MAEIVKLLKALQGLQTKVPDLVARSTRTDAAVAVRGNLEKLFKIMREEAEVRRVWCACVGTVWVGCGRGLVRVLQRCECRKASGVRLLVGCECARAGSTSGFEVCLWDQG